MCLFETTGTVPNTHKLSDGRPASVLSTLRTSMPNENQQFPGMACPFVCAFPLTVKCRCCVDICRRFSVELWRMEVTPQKARSRQTPHQMAKECPFFNCSQKSADGGTHQTWKWWIPMRHRWSPGACDRHWSAVADLMSFGTACK